MYILRLVSPTLSSCSLLLKSGQRLSMPFTRSQLIKNVKKITQLFVLLPWETHLSWECSKYGFRVEVKFGYSKASINIKFARLNGKAPLAYSSCVISSASNRIPKHRSPIDLTTRQQMIVVVLRKLLINRTWITWGSRLLSRWSMIVRCSFSNKCKMIPW